jgi:glycosyltransferase involved in cell wall biosynthesis
MQNLPKISVIVAVFNAKSTLQQCLDSFTKQSYKNKELIVIDGASTDGSIEILNLNSAFIDYWISEQDRGVFHAWNKALKKVDGDWICFLGADDYFWSEDVLTNMAVELNQSNSSVQLVYGQVMLLSQSGEPINLIGQAWLNVGKQLQKKMCVPHPGAMHRRNFFDRNGVFDETYRIAGDYEILLRGFLDVGNQAVFVPDLIAVGMRHGGLSSNPLNSLVVMQEIRKAQKTHTNSWPDIAWICRLALIYLRLLIWKMFGEVVGKALVDLARKMVGLPPYWTKV